MRPSPRLFIIALLLTGMTAPAVAQDIRGFEVCTAEKQMERRTGCLQANNELMQQMLTKLTRDTQAKLDLAARETAGAKAEIATLRATVTRLEGEIAQLKTAKPAGK